MKIVRNIEIPSKHKRTILLDAYCMADNFVKPVVIFIHGYKSFKDWGSFDLIARFFARKGFLFLKFNMSHNGTNVQNPSKIVEPEVFGKNTIEIELDDINEVVNWVEYNSVLEDVNIDRKDISLIGHSRGGSEAILIGATNEKISKVISWAGFKDFHEVWDKYYDLDEWKENGVIYRPSKLTNSELPLYYSLYENFLEHKEDFNIENAVKKIKIPLLLIHGIDDEEIDYQHALDMKKWNKKAELNLIPGASHVFGNFHPYHLPYLPNDTQIIVEDTIDFIKGE